MSPVKPLGALLFLGPTGSGKTRAVEAAAEALFGDPHDFEPRREGNERVD